MSYKWYAADFETAADEESIGAEKTYVWAWGTAPIVKNVSDDDFTYGTDIKDFFAFTLMNPGTYWFHNLKFDGAFIISFLIKNGFHFTDKNVFEMESFEYNAIINNMGQVYKIAYKVDSKVVKIQNSLLKIPGTIKQIAKSLKLDVDKGEIDYKLKREPGHILTDEEIEYLERDVLILAKAMYQLHQQNGNKKMTIGSDCLDKFKSMCPEFDNLFPDIGEQLDRFIRKAFYGGFTWANPKYQNRTLEGGATFDKNSMYPGVMHSSSGYLFPYGKPKYFKGAYKWDESHPLYIQRLIVSAKLKPNRWPTINLGAGFSRTGHSEYATELDMKTLTLTYVDLNWLHKNYDIDYIEYIDGYSFKAKRGMFDTYIDLYMSLKETATRDKDPVKRQLAKLMLNNLYGKFGTNPIRLSKIPVLDERGKLHYVDKHDFLCEFYRKKGIVYLKKKYIYEHSGYIPVAVFTTAYARQELFSAIELVWEYFCYCDTDSIHILIQGLEIALKSLDVHDTKLGAWKHESSWDKSIFIRAKTYAEHVIENGESRWDIKACGMPDNIKQEVKIEDFKIGSCWLSFQTIKDWLKEGKFDMALKKGYKFVSEGKLIPKQVDGGIILVERSFKITE